VDFRQNWFLADLPELDLIRLEPHLVPVRFERGQVLCEPGEIMDYVWFFRTGMSSDIHMLEDGFAVEVWAFGYESAFGLGSALGRVHSFTRDLCQVGGDGWKLPAGAFRAVYADSEALRHQVLRHTQVAISFAGRSMACNAHHSLDERLCRWLLTADDHTESPTLATTHEFLAIMLGVTRSSLTMALGELHKLGAVSLGRGSVGVTDRALLERRTCACYRATRVCWETLRPGVDHRVASG
jgi:CRP-like cAMP-binding protein